MHKRNSTKPGALKQATTTKSKNQIDELRRGKVHGTRGETLEKSLSGQTNTRPNKLCYALFPKVGGVFGVKSQEKGEANRGKPSFEEREQGENEQKKKRQQKYNQERVGGGT